MLVISYQLILAFVLALTVGVGVLFCFLILQREVTTVRMAYTRRRETLLAPLIHRALGNPASVPPLRRALRPGDARIVRDILLHLAPSPVTRLHRAIALRYRSGPQSAMTELNDLAEELDHYYLYYATRADLCRELGRADEARAADRRALQLTANPAEQGVLQERIAGIHRKEISDNHD